jgi:DNA transposition AAA+ family ATPase
VTEPNPTHQFIEKLGQEGRVLKQARRLPMEPLSRDQILAVRRDWMAYSERAGVTDTQIAHEVGVGAATLSQFRHNNYKGDNERIARLLNDWMERHARKQRAALPAEYVRTRVAEEIKTLVDVACTTSSMAAIVAPSGAGKTLVLKHLADKYRGRYIYCTEHMRSGSLLKAIAIACDVTKHRARGGGKSRCELLADIVERLVGTNRPLFLDEAHQLPRDAFPTIRAIHDQAGVPIIMAGASEILDHINDRVNGKGQFASRCYQYNVMEHVANVEDDPSGGKLGRPLYTQEEVRKFLDKLEVKFHGDGFELLWAIACLPNHGCLRTIRRVVHLLRPDKSKRDQPITRKEVVYAMGLLLGQMGNHIARKAEEHIEKVKAA